MKEIELEEESLEAVRQVVENPEELMLIAIPKNMKRTCWVCLRTIKSYSRKAEEKGEA